jgi:predicted DNA-binding ribbon-helix-helix protein
MSPLPISMQKRNVSLPRRRTTIKLESYEWRSVDALLDLENITLQLLCTELDNTRGDMRLVQAIRMFLLIYFRTMADNSLTIASQATQSANLMHHPAPPAFNYLLVALMQFSTHIQHGLPPHQPSLSDL